MDPENYKHFPISQYEEDNVLRELNKLLLGFQQKQLRNNEPLEVQRAPQQRRLSPIGESISSTPPEMKENHLDNLKSIIITQPSSSSNKSSIIKPSENSLKPPSIPNRVPSCAKSDTTMNRRGRFIVLGSSGECLPVNRGSAERPASVYSSCTSSEDEFHSARQSLDEGLLLKSPSSRLTRIFNSFIYRRRP